MNLKSTLSLLIGLTLFVANTYAQVASPSSRVVSFNLTNVAQQLRKAPSESLQTAENQSFTFKLPQPDGRERLFKVYDSPIMDAAFAREQPSFKTYKIIAADNPQVMGRMMVSPYGLSAVILSEGGTIGIRPRDIKNPVLHDVYSGNGDDGATAKAAFSACGFDPSKEPHRHFDTPRPEGVLGIANGTNRRTYRLAIVSTGEFHAANGATAAAAQAVITASVNAIQLFYDRELAVRFTLLTPFIYTNAATDPFDPANTTNGNGLTNQALEGVHINFLVGNYDIGHVVHSPASGGSGVAGLGVVCDDGTNRSGGDSDGLSGHNKAAGWSGSSENSSISWYNLFGHEIGHMFNMNHTFNGDLDNCVTGNHSLNTAYEIASGSTIMSYQGICGAAYNIPGGGATNLYFHANSLESSIAYMASKSCETTTATGNTPPVVNAIPCGSTTYRIPIGTPFILTGSATDANSDPIYYCWEQYDEDGTGVRPTHGKLGTAAAADALAPLFRSYPPTTSPSRTIPAMSLVATNSYASDFEPLSSVARTLNFKLTARDWNSNGGGFSTGELAVSVTGAAFSVTAPNTAMSIAAGSATTVTWSVGGATYATNVAISLSIDGGLTYPYTLLASTANDGTESVTIPSSVTNTSTARIKVEGSDGGNLCVKFFDISDANFTITSSCMATGSNICPNNAVVSVGNTGLNLGLSNFFGSTTVTSKTLNITAADPQADRAIASTQGGTTCMVLGQRAYKSFDIAVSATGTYTINTTAANGGFLAVSVFTSAGFVAATPCSSTFLGSNAYSTGGGSASGSSQFTVNLTACVVYKVMAYASTNAYGDNTVAISGSGTIYDVGSDPGAGYDYTYVAVSTADNQIKMVNASGNFTGLAVGTYQIYGISYNTSLTPSAWVNQTIAQVVASGCVLFSANNKPLAITSALPVELLSFSGKWQNNQANLQWQTASEQNSLGFDIERSLTGDTFEKVGFVKSHGTTTQPQAYLFTDAGFNTPPQYIYYRLKQVDNNGAFTYSKTIVLHPNRKALLQVYPNPTTHTLTVEHTAGLSSFEVVNTLGQVVRVVNIAKNNVLTDINTTELVRGIYYIRVNGFETIRFVKM